MKLSYRARIALMALLLVFSTLFASCNAQSDFTETTTPQETTATETTLEEITTTEPSSTEKTPEESTPEEETTPEEVTTSTEEITTTEAPATSTPEQTSETLPVITMPQVTMPEATTPQETTPAETTTAETTPTEPAPEETTTPGEHYPGIPAFSGQKYVEVNGNVPYFTKADYTTNSYETYSPLDTLGRCGVAMACLGRDLMPTGTRGSLSTNPTGWVQASYDAVDGRYLYNRSHLIGWQLTGQNDNKQNLITGTRFCNQLGMLPFENMVADYIKETGNHVLYRITPLFVGDELVARGVLMEAWSVEDNGDGICFNVFVYNAQPAIVIDYATGKSRLENDTSEKPGEVIPCDYVANKNSKKFHYPDCRHVTDMSEKNKEYHTATREEMIANGYIPCGTCAP